MKSHLDARFENLHGLIFKELNLRQISTTPITQQFYPIDLANGGVMVEKSPTTEMGYKLRYQKINNGCSSLTNVTQERRAKKYERNKRNSGKKDR